MITNRSSGSGASELQRKRDVCLEHGEKMESCWRAELVGINICTVN